MLSYDHYFSPTTLAAAFDALERVPGARLVAGATDLLPWARDGRAGDVHLPALVDVSGIAELRGVTRVGSGRLSMGAATPIAAFEHDPLLAVQAPVLARCAVWFADHQIREQATVGGNLINASPAADTLPALLVLNTHVTLARFEAGAIRERTVPLSEFMLGPGKTVCHAGEIMTRIEIDALGAYGSAFEKVGHRRSLVISTVCLAAVAKLSADQSRLDDLRIAIAAVGPVPERLADLEDQLIGKTPTPRALRDAALRVAERVRSRSRQTYRREVLVNLVERGLVAALAGAGLKIERLPKETSHV